MRVITITFCILTFLGGLTLMIGAVGIVSSFAREKHSSEFGIVGIRYLLFSALMFWLAGNL